MTYDLAVWEGDRPDRSDAAEIFAALYDQVRTVSAAEPTA